MQRSLIVDFTKMSGAGNDFIVLDNRFYNFSEGELTGIAQKYCKRRTGIGADGLLTLSTAATAGAHFRMQYFNADGSTGIMCGNGARCIARFARHAGIDVSELIFDTDAGRYWAEVPDDPSANVRLFVPPPDAYRPEVMLSEETVRNVGRAAYIWTGTDHVVCFCGKLDEVPVEVWGHDIRHDPMFSAGTNVDFVEVVEGGAVRVRTFERGVEEETLACGTGAIAAALVARLQGKVNGNRVDVDMPGGRLHVGFDYADGAFSNVYLEGPAVIVFRGTFEWTAGGAW